MIRTDTSSRFSAPVRALTLAVALAFLSVGALAPPALAQEEEDEPEAQRYENVDWHQVVLVDFQAGKTGRAMELISNNFEPASRESGTQVPHIIELQTGPWDMMLVWTMEEGPSEMTWEISPEGVEFQNALLEAVGSEEEVEEIWDEYNSLVARSTSYIGFSGRHGRAIGEQ